RIAALPALAARDVRAPLDLAEGPNAGLVTTGIGSSEAHARLLASLVAERTRRPARFVPASALVAPDAAPAGRVRLVWSHGLSPTAQLVLADAARWPRVVLATAVTEPDRLAPLRARGVAVASFAGEDEFGTLVRVTGPLAGYLCAMRLACAFGAVL